MNENQLNICGYNIFDNVIDKSLDVCNYILFILFRPKDLGDGKLYVVDIVQALHQYYSNSHENSNSKFLCLKLLQNLLKEEHRNIICGVGRLEHDHM